MIPVFGFLVLPRVVENGGGQGETGQGRDGKSYSGIWSCCTTDVTASIAASAAAAADEEDSSYFTDDVTNKLKDMRWSRCRKWVDKEEQEHGEGGGNVEKVILEGGGEGEEWAAAHVR